MLDRIPLAVCALPGMHVWPGDEMLSKELSYFFFHSLSSVVIRGATPRSICPDITHARRTDDHHNPPCGAVSITLPALFRADVRRGMVGEERVRWDRGYCRVARLSGSSVHVFPQ